MIAPDLPGLGDSRGPVPSYDKRSIAKEIITLLEDGLEISACHAVGHDWGGVVAYAMAAHFPGVVETLTIVDVSIPGDGSPNVSQNGRRWHHAFHQTAGLPEELVTGREDVYLPWFYRNYGNSPDAVPPDAVAEYLRAYSNPERLSNGFNYYRALDEDIRINTARLAEYRVSVPTMVVAGTSAFGRGAEAAAVLRRMVTNVHEVLVPDCGHWVPEEKPEILAKNILSFIAKTQAQTRTGE